MATSNYDVILRFLSDKQAQAETDKGVKQVVSDLEEVNKTVEYANKAFDILEQKMKEATSTADFDSIERGLQEVEDNVQDVTKSFQLQARVLRSEAAAITDDYAKAQVSRMRNLSQQIEGISRTGLLFGAGIVGGALAESNRFAKEVEDTGKATAATREWTRATQELAQARARVDTVLLRETLPLLRQATRVATEVSQFVERNPEIVQAALKVGVVVAGLGAVGIAVSKGIKLYADTQALLLGSQELAAAKLQDIAADKQLIAARLRAGMAGVEVPKEVGGAAGGLGRGGLGGTLGTVALYATTILIGSELGTALGNKIGEAITGGKTGRAGPGGFGLGDVAVGAGMLAQTPAFLALQGLRAVGVVSDQTVGKFRETVTALDKFAAGLLGANKILNVINSTGSATRGERGGRTPSVNPETNRVSTETLQQALKIYEDYKADDLALVQKHYEDRAKIIAGALADEQAENTKYANSVTKINTQTANALASAAEQFAQANAQADKKYAEDRAHIIRDGNEEIERIEADSKERLRKLAKEHNERVADLTAARDALGLVKEQRNYRDQVSEEKRNTQREVQQRRADIAQRLADLKQSYEEERAQRLADYQARVAEIQANAAQQLAELQQQHEEELHKIQAQKVARLRELDSQFAEERKRRYDQFVQNLRDLDAGLLGERQLRQAHYQQMEQELDAFLTAYQNKFFGGITAPLGSLPTGTTGGTVPVHDFTGYAYTGMYRMAANGQPQYVLSGAATRAAENLIGGGLTQDALLATLARGAGDKRSLTINDNSRFDGRISSAQVKAIKREVRRDMIKEFLGA